eukprot:GHRQ01037917.1.p2 GENE.GHRQ01037917.1~~GHRQ01037917.1.p2  ORF type:complete len:134 (-),score=24.39 GHRQ01037917.1:384-785(-)
MCRVECSPQGVCCFARRSSCVPCHLCRLMSLVLLCSPARSLLPASLPPCHTSLQGCASDRLIDTAVLGGPKVFVVATLASERPAAPFAFRNYELPEEAAPAAEALAACSGSCTHHVWEVRGVCRCFPPSPVFG